MSFSRVRAPELTGRGWLNTAGKSFGLQDLRGKIVLVDFWTFCCINCLHVLDELRPLEQRYADVLVTIGVHSPKFEHEKDAAAVAAAVERYGVEHPVLDDPEMTTWRSYGARAWPTLVLIDPEGYVVAAVSGEGHASSLAGVIDQLVAKHEANGTLRRGNLAFENETDATTALRFPAKAIVTPERTLLVSSSGQHQLVELTSDGSTELRRFGTGERGLDDGDAQHARFSEPNGLCALPPEIANVVGYDVIVADTVNHLLRGVHLGTGTVVTVAGTGKQWRGDAPSEHARLQDLSSPWDVAWYGSKMIVAMAGIHQLWWFDPIDEGIGIYAGTRVESLRDGERSRAFLAQPSGISVHGDTLWFVDSETSSLRWIANDRVNTAIGQGLFEFGHVDGPAKDALLQHPLGVLALDDGRVLIADTYNGAVRAYDPVADEVTTLASDLAEPSDIVKTLNGTLLIVESGAHRMTVLTHGDISTTQPISLTPGEVSLSISYVLRAGQKLDESFGSPIEMQVSAAPPSLLERGAGTDNALERTLVVTEGRKGTIKIRSRVASCDVDAEHPACHLTTQVWHIPVTVEPGGVNSLTLAFDDDTPTFSHRDSNE